MGTTRTRLSGISDERARPPFGEVSHPDGSSKNSAAEILFFPPYFTDSPVLNLRGQISCPTFNRDKVIEEPMTQNIYHLKRKRE